ncbi:MAG: hypothetical protein RLZZ08_1002 [Pseudomonadota bacterium]|jgi:hypothetical protein
MTMNPEDAASVTRRGLVGGTIGLAGGLAAAALPATASAISKSTASPRDACLVPQGAPDDGSADSWPQLQQLLDAAVGDTRPIVLNGVYRLDRPLVVRSNQQIVGTGTLRANHAGPMIAGDGRPVARVRIAGLRLEAQAAMVSCAIEGEGWQYARLENLRLLSAGGVFRTGIRFTDSAYWNAVRSLESDCTIDLFDLGDANNLVLDDINLCRYADIGIRSFLKFHAPCSGLTGRNLSIEGIFKGRTLIGFHPDCTGIDLEFLRIEGREGSSTTRFLDFAGAKGNRVVIPPAYFGLGGFALTAEAGNIVSVLAAKGSPAHRMGLGQVVLPESHEPPSVDGAVSFNSTTRRFMAAVAGPRQIALSPALEPLDMNGQPVTGVTQLVLRSDEAEATLALSADGRPVIKRHGREELVQTAPAAKVRISGSRSDGTALTQLLRYMSEAGFIIDATRA